MLLPVILSGGAGTRLWPVSREAYPKPFMHIGDTQSLLQKAVLRGLTASGGADVMVVTNREYYFLTKDELTGLASGENPVNVAASYILEPAGRNTAPAVALAALQAAATSGPETVLLVLAADHLIRDLDAFRTAACEAEKLASAGKLVLFGIQPTLPETGFGYIEMGEALADSTARQVQRFVEKPDAATAVGYLASGHFVWNSGMFCFRADAILEAFRTHAPDVLDAAQAAFTASKSTGDKREFESSSFTTLPNISIDYAVMERAGNLAVIPCNFGWSDVGSWKAVSEQLPTDEFGNSCVGDAMVIDSRNCHIQTEGRLVAAVGVDDLVIVDTADALLVTRRDRSQDVRSVVERLKKAGHESFKLHQTVARPWGTYTVLQEGPSFKIKRIVVKQGQSLSLQLHHHRSEHWIVVEGTAKVTNGENVFLVHPNESTYIPAETKHRLENPGEDLLVMIEVQCGGYLGEDDIVRFQDIYQRA